MTKERLSENDSAVKNKKRTPRVIPPGVALTGADIEKLDQRYQGPKKNPALYIKRAFQTYIEKCPGLTSTTKRVACFLVDWYRLRDGYARPPISRIAHELMIGIASVKRAVVILHDRGIVFVKSGGPSRRQGLGTIASRYVPNFWLVINRDTGEVIRNAKYGFVSLKPIDGAGDYAQNDTRGAYAQNDTRVKPLKPIDGAGDYAQNEPRYLSTSANANASPSADAPGYAPAPLPEDSEKLKIRFVRLGDMASYMNIKPQRVLEAVAEGDANMICLFEWLHDNRLIQKLPNGGAKYGHIIVHGSNRPINCTEGERGYIDLYNLESDNWIALEYRI